MQKFNLDEIIDGIIKHDQNVLSYIYKRFFRIIKNYVIKNSGNERDAQDIFQESLIVIYRQLKDGGLNLDCGFKTYLYSVCRLQWLKQLKKRRIDNENVIEIGDSVDVVEDLPSLFDDNERYSLFQEHFENLGDDCRKLLELFFKSCSLKEIAKIMGYKSENYAKKKKHFCKDYLIQSIMSDPKFKELR